MKKIIFCVGFVLFCSIVFAQSGGNVTVDTLKREVLPVTIFSYTENFEQSYYWDDYLGFNYDTLGIFNVNVSGYGSVWEIGRPNKEIWDTTFLNLGCSPLALLTDTVDSYPANNHSVVEFNITKPTWAYYYDYCWSQMNYFMYLACDTDSLKDGVYFEISFDGGASYVNLLDSIGILNANNSPDNIEMLSFQQNSFVCDTIPGFSGNVHGQGSKSNYLVPLGFLFSWEDENGFDVTESVIRMHFVSDSIDNQKQGVMIDNIYLFVDESCYVIGIDDKQLESEQSSYVYPNPVTGISKLIFENPISELAEVKIFSSTGRIIDVIYTQYNMIEINPDIFGEGFYLYQIKIQNKITTGKFIIN